MLRWIVQEWQNCGVSGLALFHPPLILHNIWNGTIVLYHLHALCLLASTVIPPYGFEVNAQELCIDVMKARCSELEAVVLLGCHFIRCMYQNFSAGKHEICWYQARVMAYGPRSTWYWHHESNGLARSHLLRLAAWAPFWHWKARHRRTSYIIGYIYLHVVTTGRIMPH